MSESLVVNSKSEVCVVKTPPVDLLLKRCGNPVCLHSSINICDAHYKPDLHQDVIDEIYQRRNTSALAHVIESMTAHQVEVSGGYRRYRSEIVAMRPAEFEDLIDAVYRAGLEDGAAL